MDDTGDFIYEVTTAKHHTAAKDSLIASKDMKESEDMPNIQE